MDGEQKNHFFNDVKSALDVLRMSLTTYCRPLASSKFLCKTIAFNLADPAAGGSVEKLIDRYFCKRK